MNKPLEKVVVIGSGFLGTQIALLSAYYGYKVSVFDSKEDAFVNTFTD